MRLIIEENHAVSMFAGKLGTWRGVVSSVDTNPGETVKAGTLETLSRNPCVLRVHPPEGYEICPVVAVTKSAP